MIEEVVSLNFEGKGLDELEARLSRAADLMVERLKSGAAGVSVGGAGTGAPGGGGAAGSSGTGASTGSALGNATGATFAAAINGAAQGMGNLTPATVSSPTLVAREAGLGAVNGLAQFAAQGLGTAVGAALGSVAGPAGTAVGAAVGNAAGSYAAAQFAKLSESIHKPEEATAARLKSYVGDLESHGVHVSDRFIEQQARFGISIERRRLEAERHAERITKETGASMSSISYGISALGR